MLKTLKKTLTFPEQKIGLTQKQGAHSKFFSYEYLFLTQLMTVSAFAFGSIVFSSNWKAFNHVLDFSTLQHKSVTKRCADCCGLTHHKKSIDTKTMKTIFLNDGASFQLDLNQLRKCFRLKSNPSCDLLVNNFVDTCNKNVKIS